MKEQTKGILPSEKPENEITEQSLRGLLGLGPEYKIYYKNLGQYAIVKISTDAKNFATIPEDEKMRLHDMMINNVGPKLAQRFPNQRISTSWGVDYDPDSPVGSLERKKGMQIQFQIFPNKQ